MEQYEAFVNVAPLRKGVNLETRQKGNVEMFSQEPGHENVFNVKVWQLQRSLQHFRQVMNRVEVS